jgi:XTP/dITP diphosphohydrolase
MGKIGYGQNYNTLRIERQRKHDNICLIKESRLKKQLLMATGNPGKIAEIKDILSQLSLSLHAPLELGLELHIQETGINYSENARLKAEAYRQAAEMPVLSDDSGLEVDVLGGAPGLYSARFSPKQNASDADRRHYLLQQLEGKPEPWKAEFRCTAILSLTDDRYYETTGSCQGVIIQEERGKNGFGYDPIFFIPEYEATMAELGSEIKNKISHRAKALQAMMPILRQVFSL